MSAWSWGCTPSIFFILIKSCVDAIFWRHSTLLQKRSVSINLRTRWINWFRTFSIFRPKPEYACWARDPWIVSRRSLSTLSARDLDLNGETNWCRYLSWGISQVDSQSLTFAGKSAQPFDMHFIGIANEINTKNIGRWLRHSDTCRNRQYSTFARWQILAAIGLRELVHRVRYQFSKALDYPECFRLRSSQHNLQFRTKILLHNSKSHMRCRFLPECQP